MSGQEVILLTCTQPLWGRYLVLDARVNGYFHLTEVEVFDGKWTILSREICKVVIAKYSCHYKWFIISLVAFVVEYLHHLLLRSNSARLWLTFVNDND